MRLVVVPIFLLFILAQPSNRTKANDVLQGLDGVYVKTEISGQCNLFSNASILREVNRVLSDAGVKTLTREQCATHRRQPRLNVYVHTVRLRMTPDTGQWVYVIQLQMKERLSLDRPRDLKWAVILWKGDALGNTNSSRDFHNKLRQLASGFAKDYRQANPQR